MRLDLAVCRLCFSVVAFAVLLACGQAPSQENAGGTTAPAPTTDAHQGTNEIPIPKSDGVWTAAGPNIIPNPSLESNADGWHGEGIKRVEDPAMAHAGKAGLDVKTSPDHPYDGAYFAATNFPRFESGPGIDCQPDTDYLASVWVKGIKDFDGVQMQLHIFSSDKTNYQNTKITLTGEWQKVEHRFHTVANPAPLGVGMVKVNSSQPVDYAIDDLEIVPAKH